MTTVLYITAHPLSETESATLQTGGAFMEAYRSANPSHAVTHIDLFDSFVPPLDTEIFQGWARLQKGEPFDGLDSSAQSKIARLAEIVDQFVAADKYVFAAPLWNLSYPPVLKAYIDAIFVAGKTFRYTLEGPVGLLMGKKAVHIQASGGVYSSGQAADLNLGHRHLYESLQFFGVETLEPIFVEGLAQFPDEAASIKLAARERAVKVAVSF
jgi:FMN-dependent NADH-azoreductase